MFSIYANDICIYNDLNPLLSNSVVNPKLTMEKNKAGTLEFTITEDNPGYTLFEVVDNDTFTYLSYNDFIIEVIRNNEPLWYGRIIGASTDFWKNVKYTCEGYLGVLNDTIQPPYEYHIKNEDKSGTEAQSVKEFLEDLIFIHNMSLHDKEETLGLEDREKWMLVDDASFLSLKGVPCVWPVNFESCNDETAEGVSIEKGELYRYTNYENTLDCIMDKLVERLGGHLEVKRINTDRITSGCYVKIIGAIAGHEIGEIWYVKNVVFDKNGDTFFYLTDGHDSDGNLIPENDRKLFSVKDRYFDSNGNTEYKVEKYLPTGEAFYLYYVKDDDDMSVTNAKEIRFGKNLLDYTKEWDFSDIATVIIPRGKSLEEKAPYSIVKITDYTEKSDSGAYVTHEASWWNNTKIEDSYKNDSSLMWYVSKSEEIEVVKTDESGNKQTETKTKVTLGSVFVDPMGYNHHVDFSGNMIDADFLKPAFPCISQYLTVATVNGGSVYVECESPEALDSLGRVIKVVDWDYISTPENLLAMAKDYLKNEQFDAMEIEISAADLFFVERDVTDDAYDLLETVRCVSKPHGLDKLMTITKVSIPLDSPENISYTFGTSNKKTLTEMIVRK